MCVCVSGIVASKLVETGTARRMEFKKKKKKRRKKEEEETTAESDDRVNSQHEIMLHDTTWQKINAKNRAR